MAFTIKAHYTIVTVGTFENGKARTFDVEVDGTINGSRALAAAKRASGNNKLMLVSDEPKHITRTYEILDFDACVRQGLAREVIADERKETEK